MKNDEINYPLKIAKTIMRRLPSNLTFISIKSNMTKRFIRRQTNKMKHTSFVQKLSKKPHLKL